MISQRSQSQVSVLLYANVFYMYLKQHILLNIPTTLPSMPTVVTQSHCGLHIEIHINEYTNSQTLKISSAEQQRLCIHQMTTNAKGNGFQHVCQTDTLHKPNYLSALFP